MDFNLSLDNNFLKLIVVIHHSEKIYFMIFDNLKRIFCNTSKWGDTGTKPQVDARTCEPTQVEMSKLIALFALHYTISRSNCILLNCLLSTHSLIPSTT